MQDLKVTLVQTALQWEDREANLAHFDQILASLARWGDVLVLPEMFSTGFTMNPQRVADSPNGRTVQWMRDKAAAYSVDITGSVVIKDDGRFYNRMFWVRPDGNFDFYDKRHLFRMAGEHKVYSAGKTHLVVNCKGWKIAPFVCYDLRFPVWLRNYGNKYDLAIFVANWPERRSSHWRLLLRARAAENQAYVVGVNRIGTDGNDIYYRGDSAVLDPLGEPLFEHAHTATVKTVSLSAQRLQEYRQKFPVWKDGDTFNMDGLS